MYGSLILCLISHLNGSCTQSGNFNCYLYLHPGLVSSNTRDFAAEVTYPHLNFSIPGTVLEPLLKCFAVTGDAEVFEELNRVEEGVRTVWRLQNTQSRL